MRLAHLFALRASAARRSAARGFSAVYFVVLLVALFAFVSLAVDIGLWPKNVAQRADGRQLFAGFGLSVLMSRSLIACATTVRSI